VHDSLLCLEMATNCEGIILSDDLVAADYLHTGKLVKPLPHVHPGRDKVYLLNRKELSDHQGLIAFKQWIQQEMQQHLTTCENLRAFKTFQFSSWIEAPKLIPPQTTICAGAGLKNPLKISQRFYAWIARQCRCTGCVKWDVNILNFLTGNTFMLPSCSSRLTV